jgi:hypothetical protein
MTNAFGTITQATGNERFRVLDAYGVPSVMDGAQLASFLTLSPIANLPPPALNALNTSTGGTELLLVEDDDGVPAFMDRTQFNDFLAFTPQSHTPASRLARITTITGYERFMAMDDKGLPTTMSGQDLVSYIASTGSPLGPNINAPAYFSPTTGLQLGTVLTVNAADTDGATTVYYSWVRNGNLAGAPFATNADTFPFDYTMNAEDAAANTLAIRTQAANAFGWTQEDSAAYAVVGAPTPGAITDLGSAAATKTYILTFFASNWAKSGSPTQSRTVASPDALKALWDSEIKVGALSTKWEITLDWDGGATYAGNANTVLSMSAPSGSTNWSDAGGWVHLKAASGKRPGFWNQVTFVGCRGLYLEGVDFLGKQNGLSGSPGLATNQACIKLAKTNSVTGEAIVTLYNSRVGRYTKTLVATPSEYILGLWSDGTAEQVVVDTCAFAGNFAHFKLPARRAILTNSDFSKGSEDFLKTYPQTKTGFQAVYHYDKITIRDMVQDISTAAFHSDLLQTAGNDTSSGTIMLMTDVWDERSHTYGGSGGGGTQGTILGNPSGRCNNLFCWINSGVFVTAPNAFSAVSIDATHTSYIERCSLGRAGISPSGFGGDPASKDWSPGINQNVRPVNSGTAFKVVDSLVGKKVTATWISYTNTDTVDYTVSRNAPIPEDAYLGADFERGGATTANSIANKFGYELDNTDQASFITSIIANFTAKGAYSAKGAPAPNPANYSAPALG